MVKKKYKKGVNSLIILGAWVLWKHRNGCVFDGVAPSVITIMRILKEEHTLWCLAGARKLQGLGLIGAFRGLGRCSGSGPIFFVCFSSVGLLLGLCRASQPADGQAACVPGWDRKVFSTFFLI
jgi:hypothetical protein